MGCVGLGTGHLVGRRPHVSTFHPSPPAARRMATVAGTVTMVGIVFVNQLWWLRLRLLKGKEF